MTVVNRRRVLVATDARRREVYWRSYSLDATGAGPEGDPQVGRAADLPSDVAALPTLGRGGVLYPEALPRRLVSCEDVLDVDAADLADLAGRLLSAGETLADPEPLYLRRPDAVPSAHVKSVLPR